ncbi:MAG: FAD-dependent oxidoreductase [Sedimentisphaerales bacterium]|nr:FAD-dependent oxidoreductase [Sedimentisphaerales bacterium]
MTAKLAPSLQIAALVAHQLKEPVTASIMMLRSLLNEYAGSVTAQQRQLLERILIRCEDTLQTAQRLMNIVKALDRPDAFQGRVNLVALAHQVRHRYADQAYQQRIELAVQAESGELWVRGYEPALREVLESLVHNALKYTPDQGRIRIGVTADDDGIHLVIEDSGIGIPETEYEKVFEPFYRTAAAQTTTHPGTGLGLTLVKAVVEAVGGQVVVGRSDLGGARFAIRLHPAPPETQPAPGETDMIKPMKVVIVGGVAAGPKVASKIVRLMPNAEVTIVEKGRLLSYAGCGLPFYISGVVKHHSKLMSSPLGDTRDPVFFQNIKNVRILNQTEALAIDRHHKRIRVRERFSNADTFLEYNKLVLATGALPLVPEIPGIDLQNIFTLHGVSDAEGIRALLESGRANDVIILGGGLIGIEITEALVRKGCRVTILEKRRQILRMLDWEIAKLVEHHLESQGVKVLTNTRTREFRGDGKVQEAVTDQGILATNMVVVGVGVRPNVPLAEQAGLQLGATGAIAVNAHQQTSDPDIYAAGDCAETLDLITGKPTYVPLGSNANRQGRVAAIHICGGNDGFPGVLRSTACKVLDYGIARTGMTEAEARRGGYEVICVLAPGPDKEHFVPDARLILLKLVVDRRSRRLLGAQAVGPGHVDKRIDVAAMAIFNRMTVDQLAHMDLCYAPQYSQVMDNILTAANIARNKLDGHLTGISPMELHDKMQHNGDLVLLDVRSSQEFEQFHLPHSINIPLGSLRQRLAELPRDREMVTLCNYSLRGYEAQLILRAAGFANVRVLDGGLEMWPYEKF